MISQIPKPRGSQEEQIKQLYAALTRLRDEINYEFERRDKDDHEEENN